MTGAVGPVQSVPGPGTGGETAILAVGLVTAAVGAFVAYQAVRGYRRNDSRPMLYLGVGILLLTTFPVALNYGLEQLGQVSSAQTLLALTVANVLGLGAILYSLTRP